MHQSTRQNPWYICALAALLWLPSAFALSPGDSPQPPTSCTATPAYTKIQTINFEQGDAQEWADAMNALMGLSDSAPPLHLKVTDEGRKLTIHGTEKNVAAVASWIKTIRQLAARRPQDVRAIRLEYATATEVAALVNKVAAAANSEDKSPTITIVPDERTNSVVLLAKPATLQRWTGVVHSLDAALASNYDSAAFDTTHVDLLVVSVSCPPDKHASLDAAALQAEATTPETFLAALKQLGDVRVLSTASGPIDLSKDSRIVIGTQMPFVRSRTTTKSGQLNTSIQYEDVGMDFELHGAWSASHANTGRYHAEFELSFLKQCELPGNNPGQVPAFHQFKIDNAGEMTSGNPIIFFAANADADQKSSPIAVCRLVLTKAPKPTK